MEIRDILESSHKRFPCSIWRSDEDIIIIFLYHSVLILDLHFFLTLAFGKTPLSLSIKFFLSLGYRYTWILHIGVYSWSSLCPIYLHFSFETKIDFTIPWSPTLLQWFIKVVATTTCSMPRPKIPQASCLLSPCNSTPLYSCAMTSTRRD